MTRWMAEPAAGSMTGMFGWVRWVMRQGVVLAQAVAGLVWPVTCAACGRLDVALCATCAGSMAGPPFLAGALPGPVPIWGLSAYGGAPARLIVAWKQRGRRDLTRPLGHALSHAVSACLAGAPRAGPRRVVWLVPMPARAAALRQRGADLPYDLAAAAASALPGVRAVRLLHHARRVRDQVGLSSEERRLNLAGAFTLRGAAAGRCVRGRNTELAGRRCIIVDDIVTTGASVAEAVRVLTAAGAQVVGVCCLSVTFRQRGVLIEPERTSLPSWKAPSRS